MKYRELAPIATGPFDWRQRGEFTEPQLQPYDATVKRLAGAGTPIVSPRYSTEVPNPSRRRRRRRRQRRNPMTLGPVGPALAGGVAAGGGILAGAGAATLLRAFDVPAKLLGPAYGPTWGRAAIGLGVGVLGAGYAPNAAPAFAGAMLAQAWEALQRKP